MNVKCEVCNGEGRVGRLSAAYPWEPWSKWGDLPPGSDYFVQLGFMKPTVCPECGGSGGQDRPTIVCLCGSTRFKEIFSREQFNETMAGKVVLTIGSAWHSDQELFVNYSEAERQEIKNRLDALHLKKVEMADEVLILNIGGYIGESTKRELARAAAKRKLIRFLCPLIGESLEFWEDLLASGLARDGYVVG